MHVGLALNGGVASDVGVALGTVWLWRGRGLLYGGVAIAGAWSSALARLRRGRGLCTWAWLLVGCGYGSGVAVKGAWLCVWAWLQVKAWLWRGRGHCTWVG